MKLLLLFILLIALASIVALLKKTYFPNPSTITEVIFWVAETLVVAIIFVLYIRKNGLKVK